METHFCLQLRGFVWKTNISVISLIDRGDVAPSSSNNIYSWLKILQAKPLCVCAYVWGCFLSCVCTTEHSLVLWLCAWELCLIFETQKRRRASWCIIKHTLFLPLLTCAKYFVNLFVCDFKTYPRDLDSSGLIPPSPFFCPSRRIFPLNLSFQRLQSPQSLTWTHLLAHQQTHRSGFLTVQASLPMTCPLWFMNLNKTTWNNHKQPPYS